MEINCPECLTKNCKNATISNGKCDGYRPSENMQRVIKQNNLYWKCLEIWCEHKKIKDDGSIDYDFNTKDKCHSQIRWAVKYIDRESVTHFIDKNGKSFLHFNLDTISFKTSQKKANQFYDDAFKFMADELGITVEELIQEAKSMMHSK